MKKIAVGAFPLVSIDKIERKMVENYLINTLSDLINVNQLSADINSDRARFITPMSILNFIKENKTNFEHTSEVSYNNMETERESKAKSIKRAFKNTKNLYSAISNDPFYRDNVFYPIYIEETIKSGNYTDYKYDFLILSNDLVKTQILDEIQYDDRITLLFLILKCILLPDKKLTDLGKNIGGSQVDIRKYFAVYLETCKNNNINPIDMFVKVINLAGIQKRTKGGKNNTNKLFGLLTSKGVKPETAKMIHSSNFLNLFDNTGEIKDAYFLTNLSQVDIAKFIEDDIKMDPNYNIIGRQYAQAKTHEYGRILSIIDSLKVFNNAPNMVQDLNSNEIMQKIKLAKSANNQEEEEVSINIDQILNDIETIYFRQFLQTIQNVDFGTVKKIYMELGLSLAPKDIKSQENDFNQKIDTIRKEIETYQKEIDTINNLIDRNTTDDGYINDTQLNINLNQKLSEMQNKYKFSSDELLKNQNGLYLYKMRNASNTDGNMTKEQYMKREFSAYQISLEEFSAYLTGLYAQLYTYFNSKEFLTDLESTGSQMMQIEDFKKLNIYNRVFKMDLMEISSLFKNHYLRKFDSSENNIEVLDKAVIKNLFKSDKNVSSKIENILRTKNNILNEEGMETIFFENLIRPIFKKYSNAALVTANHIKDLRIEKNPLLKKLFNNANMFKSFILTDDILIQAYDILHYLDNLKYEVGLINTPVSKVFNVQNKIQFMINRLGMNEFPVFIMNKSKISLSMPNHLSMTGNNFISTVSASAFKEIATINHVKVWSNVNMFGGLENSKAYKDIERNITRIKKDIIDAEKDLKIEKDKKKKADLQKKLDRLKVEQEKKRMDQQKLKEQASNPYNFSPNMERSVRPNYQAPNDYQFNNPGQPQRYPNTSPKVFNNNQNEYRPKYNNQNEYRPNYNNSNQNANYNPNETRDNFIQGRNNVDGLQKQSYYDQGGNQPFQNSKFMNNPYIQNRINELNNNQN